jgi:hypothetical protein
VVSLASISFPFIAAREEELDRVALHELEQGGTEAMQRVPRAAGGGEFDPDH